MKILMWLRWRCYINPSWGSRREERKERKEKACGKIIESLLI
jgi:hypothetical protein